MDILLWVILALLLLLILYWLLRRIFAPKPKKECVVKVIDWPEEDNDNHDFQEEHPDALTAGSKEDMAEKVLSKIREKDCCIKKLVLLGHGTPGNISMGAGRESITCKEINGKSEEWQDALRGLQGKFCDDAEIIMFGCNVGQCNEGATKLAEVADFFGVTVKAPTRAVYAREDPDDVSDQKAEPGQTPEPKGCDLGPEDHVKKKEVRTDATLPAAEDVEAMAVYTGTRPFWEDPPAEIEYNITDPAQIRSLLDGVDYSEEFEGRGLKAKYDAKGFVRTRSGEELTFHVLLVWQAIELRREDERSIFLLKSGAPELFRESAITM